MADERFAPKDHDQAIACVVEEAGEVIAAFGKLCRYGAQSINPLLRQGEPHYNETNYSWLCREIADLMKACETMKAFHLAHVGKWL